MQNLTNPLQNDPNEEYIEKSLRPKRLDEMIGRDNEIESLKIMIEAAKKRGEALDHILFHGPPGLGKTSISQVISSEMGVPIYITSGPAIERQGDLASILTNIQDRGILFIDEIHRLNKTVEEILYPAMEDKVLDLIIGKGPSAKTVRLDLNDFTLIGATTKVGKLSAPLRDRFGISYRFDFYEVDDLKEILKQKARLMGIQISEEAARLIASRARKTPRIAIRILKRVRDIIEINNKNLISNNEVEECLAMLKIDSLGLDILDRKILNIIIHNYEGGPVGLNTLAASISEEINTIEDVYEPFLIQEGLIKRTAKGRMITQKAINHLNNLNLFN